MDSLNLISGQWVKGSGGTAPIISPWSGEPVGLAQQASHDEAEDALRVGHAARREMSAIPSWRRRAMLDEVACSLTLRSDELVECLVNQAGKTIAESNIEVERAIEGFRAYSAALLSLEGTVVPLDASAAGEDRVGFEQWEPAGLVVAIAPFNSPLNLVAAKVAAALAAGCPVAIKPPLECPGPTTILGEGLVAAGWPDGAAAILNGGPEVGSQLVAAPQPRVIAFTGSSKTGESIARLAGIKRLVLELGSIAPTFVCDDALIDDAVHRLIRGAFGSSGQACISTQRLFVQAGILDEFLSKFVTATARLSVGDPRDPDTDLGPLISQRAADRTMEVITEAVDRGATAHTGHRQEGRCVWPTVLTDVPSELRACSEEIFGPVVVVTPFDADGEAIAEANSSPYGLQAGVFTTDIRRALVFARSLEYGSVQINDSSRVRLDGHAFGGRKLSGMGTEGTQHLLRAMLERKFVGLRVLPPQ